MWIFRNREIKRQIGILALGTAFCVVAGALCARENAAWAAGFALFCSLFWCVIYLRKEYVRYRGMRQMAEQIDEILHGEEILELEHFKEGDLEILRDEVHKMTVKLKEQTEQLRRDKTALADALADISHQIRTPLTALSLLLARLASMEMAEDAAGRKRLIREARQMLDKIEWLVTALLKMSKLDAGAIVLNKEQILLPEFLEEVRKPFEITMDVHEKSWLVTGAEGKSFCGDYAWTLEAVQNVVKNGLEYTPDGGKLVVSCAENPLYTEIRITDSGKGIPSEDMPHLFERFYRGKNAGQGSFGIGLALAQMILSRENAVIQAQNAPEGGGQFRIRFYKMVL
ncbi:HAMP domain-containing sensor histidine kinase [Roseburia hominis]